jgi:predicted metal-dependent HD superfamily phosphohydrolase
LTADLIRLWPTGWPSELRRRLEAAYDADDRGYHDRRHLAEVLANVELLMSEDEPAREAVLLAAWFHDAVYEGSADDEERSAQLAESALAERPELAREVGRLVRLTATHRPTDQDHAGQVLCDADLAILAAEPDRYASYTRGVREEHADVGDADFAAGRAAVLRALLEKPTLFHTAHARQWWEQPARANIERELAHLDTA